MKKFFTAVALMGAISFTGCAEKEARREPEVHIDKWCTKLETGPDSNVVNIGFGEGEKAHSYEATFKNKKEAEAFVEDFLHSDIQ